MWNNNNIRRAFVFFFSSRFTFVVKSTNQHQGPKKQHRIFLYLQQQLLFTQKIIILFIELLNCFHVFQSAQSVFVLIHWQWKKSEQTLLRRREKKLHKIAKIVITNWIGNSSEIDAKRVNCWRKPQTIQCYWEFYRNYRKIKKGHH